MSVFVTVGTTTFDKLISTVTSPEFQAELLARGYTHMTVQTGRYPDPHTIQHIPGMTIRHYDYSRSIQVRAYLAA